MDSKIKVHAADTCSPDDSVQAIAKKMSSKKVRRFFIVDKKKKLSGIITTVDITGAIGRGKNLAKTKVKDVMTKKVKYVDVDDNLDEALNIMNSLKTFVCPVVKDGALLGVLSYQEILAGVISAARSVPRVDDAGASPNPTARQR